MVGEDFWELLITSCGTPARLSEGTRSTQCACASSARSLRRPCTPRPPGAPSALLPACHPPPLRKRAGGPGLGQLLRWAVWRPGQFPARARRLVAVPRSKRTVVLGGWKPPGRESPARRWTGADPAPCSRLTQARALGARGFPARTAPGGRVFPWQGENPTPVGGGRVPPGCKFWPNQLRLRFEPAPAHPPARKSEVKPRWQVSGWLWRLEGREQPHKAAPEVTPWVQGALVLSTFKAIPRPRPALQSLPIRAWGEGGLPTSHQVDLTTITKVFN